MLDIPSALAMWISAGALVAGALLLLWGRRTGGLFLMLGGAGAGLAISDLVIRLTGQNPIVVQLASAVVLAFAAWLTSRALWAEMAADVAALAGYAVVIVQGQLPLPDFAGQFQWADNGWRIDLAGLGKVALLAVTGLWKANAGGMMVVGGAAALTFIAAIVLGRAARILMTSLLGAAGVVGGTLLLCLTLRPGLGPVLRDYWYIPAGMAGAFFAAGAAFQWQQGSAAAKAARAMKAEKEALAAEKKHNTGQGRSSDD